MCVIAWPCGVRRRGAVFCFRPNAQENYLHTNTQTDTQIVKSVEREPRGGEGRVCEDCRVKECVYTFVVCTRFAVCTQHVCAEDKKSTRVMCVERFSSGNGDDGGGKCVWKT